MFFSAYIYDVEDKLLASRSEECLDKLTVKLVSLLENFPMGTVGIIYSHDYEQVIGKYMRRAIE